MSHPQIGSPHSRRRPFCAVLERVPIPPPSSPPRRPLVVSADDDLLDDVLRVLAAARSEPELATGGALLSRAHRTAPLVLIGADVLAGPAVRALPRRPGVLVVARDELPADAWAIAVELGAERVVVLPQDETWLLARASKAVRVPVEQGGLVVVSGSCGGAGASTLAVALSLTAAAECGGALLVDADPGGGGLDLLLGAEHVEGVRWPELAGLRGRVSGEALLAAVPEVDGLHVLSAARGSASPAPEEALAAVVAAVRAEGRSVVVDLPRGSSAAGTLLAEADLVALVVPARLRAACAARLLVEGSAEWSAAGLVLRRAPGGLGSREVGDLVGRPIAAELPDDRSAAGRADRGRPPSVSARSPWGRVSRALLAGAGILAEAVR
jgi:secretion/DNA translocation related CpaE-like protein